MSRSLALYSSLSIVLAAAAAACSSDFHECPTPQARRECSCGGDVEGVQHCMPEKVWSDCDCSVGLPPADAGLGGASGGGAGGAGGGAGGMSGGPAGASAGAAGHAGAGAGASAGAGAGGSAGTVAPAAGAGAGGAGGATAGAGGAGGAGGSMADAKPAYGGCTEASVAEDCRSGSICVVTSFTPADVTVCAPACSTPAQCPVPEGEYDAMVVCTEGHCRIDCTGELLAPLSCPSGMICAEQVLGTSYCHAEA